MGDSKEWRQLSQPYTYIHVYIYIYYILKVSEPKVRLSVEIFCAQMRFAF